MKTYTPYNLFRKDCDLNKQRFEFNDGCSISSTYTVNSLIGVINVQAPNLFYESSDF